MYMLAQSSILDNQKHIYKNYFNYLKKFTELCLLKRIFRKNIELYIMSG